MNEHLSSAGLKSLAKGQLLGKYGTVIGVCAIHLAYTLFISITGNLINTSSFLGMVIFQTYAFIGSLLFGLIVCGEAYIYLKIACKQQISISDLFFGFKHEANKILKIQFVLSLINLVCILPLNIGLPLLGSDNAYSVLFYVIWTLTAYGVLIFLNIMFSQSYYLMLDFPQYTAKEVLLMSKKVMKGNKGRLFYLYISFLPLVLFCGCTCCIALLWLLPYIEATKANFYLDLMKKRN